MALPYYLKSNEQPTRTNTALRLFERAIREVVWALFQLKPRDIMNLAVWVMILTGLGTAYHYAGITPVSSSTRHILSTAQSASAPAHELEVRVLPAGPSGQLLPPGTMAPISTYDNSYASGQCTWYVSSRRQVPNNWGDARNWYHRAQANGWSVGDMPAVASIAWTSAGPHGHVALVEAIQNGQVLVSEMNYLGPYRFSKRWAPISSFRYIY